jgi:lysophospholipase L1-like esterase
MADRERQEGGRRGAGEWLARIGLLLAGLAIAALVVEGLLRSAALLVSPRAVPEPGGRQTILTLGDSHTYGVFFEAEESYPGRLAALLEDRSPGGYRVINRGLPGTNSSELVSRLPGWLDEFAPSQVVVCVGANNVWNRSGAEGPEQHEAEASPFEGLRTLRLLRLLRLRLDDGNARTSATQRPEVVRDVIGEGDVAVEFRDAGTGELLIRHEGNFLEPRTLRESFGLLRNDLERIHALTEARGVRLVLLTYAEHPVLGAMTPAQRNHAGVNQVLRHFARERDVALVDVAPVVGARLARGEPPDVYFHSDGSHLKPAGYAVVARRVAQTVGARD